MKRKKRQLPRTGEGGSGFHPLHPIRTYREYPGLEGVDRVSEDEPYWKRKMGMTVLETPDQGIYRIPPTRLRALSDVALYYRGQRGRGVRNTRPSFSDAELLGSGPYRRLVAARLGL